MSIWTVILAAGEGSRLRALTRAIHGEDLPKQYAALQGESSLLQKTAQRARQWSQLERIVVVVAEDREALARAQLGPFPGVDIVAQPVNIGTAPGLLLPLARLLSRDANAQVVVLPSDHYVREEEVFTGAVHRALDATSSGGSVALLGAVPETADTQYGWIVPSVDSRTGRQRVSEFREKPADAVARDLRAQGALWSTFVMAGAASRFWQLGCEWLPAQTRAFEVYREALGSGHERQVLSRLYERMAAADFSRDVLERAEALEVVALPACGWSDWGTPERVLDSLRGTPDHEELSRRIERCSELRLATVEPADGEFSERYVA